MTATALTTGDDAEDQEGQGGMTGLQSGQLTGWLLADRRGSLSQKSHSERDTVGQGNPCSLEQKWTNRSESKLILKTNYVGEVVRGQQLDVMNSYKEACGNGSLGLL